MNYGTFRIIIEILGLTARGLQWWRHQMETFSVFLTLCVGNSVTGEFPSQRPVTRSVDVLFDLRLNERLSKQDAGDFRRHRTDYDVTVMVKLSVENQFILTLMKLSRHYTNQELVMLRPISCTTINVCIHRADKFALRWRHYGRDSVSNHQPHECLLNCLFRRR